jgi:zinc protease
MGYHSGGLMRSTTISLAVIVFTLSLFLPFSVNALPPVHRSVLSNGLVLLSAEEHSLPFVTLLLLVDAGAWKDEPGQEGLSYMTARGLTLGTSRRGVSAINEELDFMGASLGASSSRDYATVSLRVLKKDLDEGLDLLMETITEATFPEDELRREQEKTLAGIQSQEDEPEDVAEKAFRKELFLTGPYAHPVEGTKESVPKLTRESILKFYRAYYHPNGSILAVVGDLTAEELNAKVITRFLGWPKGKAPDTAFRQEPAKGLKTVKIDRPITQANIILGHAGVSRENPDYYALTVMNYILGGGGFSSRMVEEVRDKRGLAYAVVSYFDPGKYAGSFQVVLQTKNASAREAISLSLKEIERIQTGGVSEKELEAAKKYLIGSFPMRFDTQGKLVNFLTQVEYYNLGQDYPEKYPTLIGSVTGEQVLRVAKTYLHPEQVLLVVVANLKEAGME